MNPQDDQRIRELFQQLRQADQKLIPAFPELEVSQASPGFRWPTLLLAGGIAALALLAGLWTFYPQPVAPQIAGTSKIAEAPVAGPLRINEVEAPALPVGGPARKRAPRRAAMPVTAQESFIPLVSLEELPDIDSATVVRVELAPSSLRAMGLAIEDIESTGPVRADLVIGQDGLARAIRILPANSTGVNR